MAIINGYSYGQVIISTSGDIPETITVDLPLTNYNGGLKDSIVFRGVNQELINLDIENKVITLNQEPIGFQLSWDFFYGDFITGTNLYNKFYPILRAWKNKWSIKLIPRVDMPERYFYVKLINETLTLALRRGGANAKYHKGALFTFQTVETQSDPNWYLVPEPNTNFRVYINEFNYNA